MTAFFIPGIARDAATSSGACGEIRLQNELDMGRRPGARRMLLELDE